MIASAVSALKKGLMVGALLSINLPFQEDTLITSPA
tara:strand:+ start:310 stop:417 length:108 start_codon:yes stop_codon:yes gene_type:complete